VAITADQQSRTEAQAIDVELRFYTALRADVDEAAIAADVTYSPDEYWQEITAKVTGEVRFSNVWDVGGAIIDWTARLSGVDYDSILLAPGRLLLALHRLWCPATGWTEWVVWFCGYIEALPGVSDDHRRGGEWEVSVRSLSLLLEADDAPAHVFGRRDLALEGSATASSTLTDIVGEMGKGEFAGTPPATADMAVDGNLDTLWISNGAPTLTAETPYTAHGDDYAINEIYRETLAEGPEYRWFELFCRHEGETTSPPGLGFRYLTIYSQSSGKWLDFSPDKSNVQELVPGGTYAVICYDRRYFSEHFHAGAAVVLEWRHLVCNDYSSGADWNYDPEGDVLRFGADSRDVVVFGNANPAGVVHWIGPAAPQPGPGQSLRRNPVGMCSDDNCEASNFILEDYPSPGKAYTGTEADWEWISVDLGTLAWELGDTLEITDTEAVIAPNTDGLTNSGQIIIGADVIDYTGKTQTTLTGVSNIAGEHTAGSAVYQYENEAATALWKVGAVGWERREVYEGSTPVVPQVFDVWMATVSNPVRPGTAGWRGDWTKVQAVQDYSGFSWQMQLIASRRARHVMLVIKQMRDSGRAKINELHIFADEWTIENEDDSWLDGVDIETIIEHLLETHYGLADAQVTVAANGFIGDVTTQKASYVEVVAELCRRTGCILRFNRVPRINIIADPTWGMHGTLDTQYTIERDAALDVHMARSWREKVGQVQLIARNAVEKRTYVVSYPESAGEGGIKQIMGEIIVGSEVEARQAAERRWKELQARRLLEVAMSGISDEWCRPGVRVAVTWDMDESDEELEALLFLVEGIDVAVKMGQPKGHKETVRLREYVP